MAFPLGPSGGWLWVFGTAGRPDDGEAITRVSVSSNGSASEIRWQPGWSWRPVWIAPDSRRDFRHENVVFKTEPVWNPKQEGFRKDLGFRVHEIRWLAAPEN